jgi:L-seryl-tRNA(Ser) seleniumtransferase
LADVVALARRSNVPVVHDLGVGSIVDCASLGLPNQPVAKDSIDAGADLVLLAGDKLLGGPRCGIILGKRSLVQTIRKHPLMPAMQADPATLAALAATLRLYEDQAVAERSIPLLSMLATPLENLRNRAERLAPQISATGVAAAEVREGTTTLTGAAVPGQTLPTVSIWLTPASGTAAALAAALRMATPSVVGRVADDRVVLDLRSVPPRSDVPLVSAVEGLARNVPAGGDSNLQPSG